MGLASFLFSLADVHCEQCQHKLKLEDIKDKETLVCQSCGHVKPISKRGEFPQIEFDKSLVQPTNSVNIERRGSIFIIEKKWFSHRSKWLLAIAALWNLGWVAFFTSLHMGALSMDLPPLGSTEKVAILIIGLLLLAWALRSSLNRTRIMIKNSKMVVSTSPFHWGDLEIYDIQQIDGMRMWRFNKKSGQLEFSFQVDMLLKDGSSVTLCPAENCNEAAYIEKTLEEFLTIEQTPVVVDPLVS